MRAVIQRVSKASVTIDGRINGQIGLGLLVLLGIEDADNLEDIIWLSNKNDSLKFRVPSLRNVDFSSHYFHDGRYSSIQRCLDHYRNDVIQSGTLDPLLTNGISLTDTDVINLVAFLRALSDSAYIKDVRFAKPTF